MSQVEVGHKTVPSGTALRDRSRLPWWLSTVVVLGALLTATGGVIALVHPAMLVSPRDEINGAVRIYAGYLAARNLVLAIMLLTALTLGARRVLSNLMILTAFIQLVDTCMDFSQGRWAIVPGVFVFGVIFFIGAARLCGYPFWRREAWI